MYNFTGSGRTRQINLAGSSSSQSSEDLLKQARARREARELEQKRHDSQARIVRWYRALCATRQFREHYGQMFDSGPGMFENAVDWTGCLLVCGTKGEKGEARLDVWCTVLLSDTQAIYAPFSTHDATRWLDMLCRITTRLLQIVSAPRRSPRITNYLSILQSLLIPQNVPNLTGTTTQDIARRIMVTLIHTKTAVYPNLSRAIMSVDPKDKSSPILPPLIELALSPLALFQDAKESETKVYQHVVEDFFSSILSIPSLPYRLPVKLITRISTRFPFLHLEGLDLHSLVNKLESAVPSSGNADETKVELIANLYTLLPPPALDRFKGAGRSLYLNLLSTVFNSLPPGSLESRKVRSTSLATTAVDVDSDSESDSPATVSVTPLGVSTQFLSNPRTRKRLEQFAEPTYINALLGPLITTQLDVAICQFFLSLWNAWPSKKNATLAALLALPGSASSGNGASTIAKGIWRSQIRGSLGLLDDGTRDSAPKSVDSLTNKSTAKLWPSLVFFLGLYTHMLRTMSDDEFFSTPVAVVGQQPQTHQAQNPLSTSEVAHFGRALLSIVFKLYLHDATIAARPVPGLGGITFGLIREWGTEFLQGVCLRDSRRRFTPEGHWIMADASDAQQICAAALIEDENSAESGPSSRRSQPSTSQIRRAQLASLSPRSKILTHIPFSIPFDIRVQVFRQFVQNDWKDVVDRQQHNHMNPFMRGRQHVTIRRGRVAEDGFKQLGEMKEDMKLPISITFKDQWGNEEAGIDGGGVFKEFLTSLAKEVFDLRHGLWLANKQQELYPNPHMYAKQTEQLKWFRFIGRVLGKALYDGILVDIAFASFFLAKLLGRQSPIDDLASLDPELYQGLMFLKNYKGNPEELSLNFTITDDNFGEVVVTNLAPNGADCPVTAENRYTYIQMVAHYRLKTQIRKQSDAFMEGLADIIDPKWLRMFNQEELQMLMGGTPDPINLDDLRENVVYGGLYDESHENIRMFWKVVKDFNQDQRRALLRFVTSCSRPPLLGFKELNPRFAIRDATSDDQRLPTASTCVNLLKLPRYSSEYIMRQKVLQAISSNAGFDLS